MFTYYGDIIEVNGQALSLSVCAIVARRMGMVDENTTYAETRKWLASDDAEVKKMLKIAADLMQLSASEAAGVLGADTSTWAQQFYEHAGVIQSENPQETLDAEMAAVGDNLRRLCDSSAIGFIDSRGNFLPFGDFYKNVIDEVIRGFATGQNTANEIKKAAQTLAQGGLRVRYESGYTMNVASAARQSAITGIGNAVQDMREAMGQEFGADGVEISAHALCAPDHLPYQGKQYSNEEFEEIQESLYRKIAIGHNCHHTTRPVILGVSTQSVSEKERQQMVQSSQKEVSYFRNGKEYKMTAYEGTQYQRVLENEIRKRKMRKKLLEDAGISTAGMNEEIEDAINDYKDISEQIGIQPQIQRLDIYELG